MTPASEAAGWMSLVRTDGLATVLVIFGMIVSVWVIRWMLLNVATPMTSKGLAVADAHITFLNENTKATQAITSGVGQVITVQGAHGEKINDIHELLVVRRAGVSQQQVSQNTKPAEPGNG